MFSAALTATDSNNDTLTGADVGTFDHGANIDQIKVKDILNYEALDTYFLHRGGEYPGKSGTR